MNQKSDSTPTTGGAAASNATKLAGDWVLVPAHGLETIKSAATLLEQSNNLMDQREGQALRSLLTQARQHAASASEESDGEEALLGRAFLEAMVNEDIGPEDVFSWVVNRAVEIKQSEGPDGAAAPGGCVGVIVDPAIANKPGQALMALGDFGPKDANYNSCHQQAAKALRYLADHDRPIGGEQFPNSECCYQIAEDLERSFRVIAEAAASTPKGGLLIVCDGKEQEAFEAWASKEGMAMQTHPLHWLFLDSKTAAARKGWRAGIEYCSEQIATASRDKGGA